jgi:uncharacterized protein (TIGR02453 family)
MPRAYFSPATFKFLRALNRNNNRDWFLAHKADYERDVRDPFVELITDMQAPLAKISGHFRADPRKNGGSMFRIYRDTRFSGDKDPYKPWASARFFHERRHEIPAPSFYVHIKPGDCFVGGGMWHPEPDALKRIRAFIADNPAAWKRATQSKAFRDHFELLGESLSRPPRGFDPGHELIEDLKRKSFAAGEAFEESLACSSELLPYMVDSYKRIAPMIDYLCASQELEF